MHWFWFSFWLKVKVKLSYLRLNVCCLCVSFFQSGVLILMNIFRRFLSGIFYFNLFVCFVFVLFLNKMQIVVCVVFGLRSKRKREREKWVACWLCFGLVLKNLIFRFQLRLGFVDFQWFGISWCFTFMFCGVPYVAWDHILRIGLFFGPFINCPICPFMSWEDEDQMKKTSIW